MILVQYANCIKGKLIEHGYDDVELRFDIWRSMNGRFNQRQIDPRIDLLSSETTWSPFKETPWLLPLLTNLSDWRTRMQQIETELSNKNQDVVVTFVADFPGKRKNIRVLFEVKFVVYEGLHLENYIPPDLNTTIEVLEGQVIVEMLGTKRNVTLNVGQNLTVPSGDYHNGKLFIVSYFYALFSLVYTVSPTPSCYMYVYLNQSDVEIVHLWDRYYNLTDQMLNETIKERRPLFPDKEEADLIRLSYEDVFAKLRSQSLHELLDISSDYQLNKKNSSNIDWTNIRLQFETSMNRSLVKRLETKIQWHEKHQRNLKSFFDKKKKQFGRWFV